MTETPDPTQTPALTDRLALEADVADEAGTTWLADLLREAAVTIQQGAAARRTFLERAVNHPGPPLSEMERYDPDADIAELECAVIERMDLELAHHRELMEIRGEAEGILNRTQDPSRSTVQVFKDLLAHFVALRSIGQGHTRESVLQRDLDRWRGWAPSWIAWPYAPTEASKAMDCDGLRLELAEKIERSHNMVAMLRRRCERYEGWWALPVAQRHPLGPEFSDGVGSSRPDLAEIEQIVTNAVAKRYPNGGHHEETLPLVERVRREIGRGLRALPSFAQRDINNPGPFNVDSPLGRYESTRDAVAEHIRAAGGDPENATVAQIADALSATNYFGGGVTVPNAAADGLDYTPDQKGQVGSIEVVGGDALDELGLARARPVPPLTGGLLQVHTPADPLMPVEIVMSLGFATFKPEATSVIWAGKVISTGNADLSLQMEDPVLELSVFNFEDSMGRIRKQSGKGRLWLALDDATAERLGFYRGAGLDGPVSLILLWPSSDSMRFEVRLGDAPDNLTPPAQSPGARRQWYGYQIEVCPYPGPAADLFQARNRP